MSNPENSSSVAAKRCECFLELTDSERAARWKGVFEHDWVPITSPILQGVAGVGSEEFAFFELDRSRVSKEQLESITQRAAKAFPVAISEIRADIAKADQPIIIKGEGVIVHWCELHTRIATTMSYDEEDVCEHGTPYSVSCEFCDAEQERAEELEAEDFDPGGPGL